jgi:hypothetical protein
MQGSFSFFLHLTSLLSTLHQHFWQVDAWVNAEVRALAIYGHIMAREAKEPMCRQLVSFSFLPYPIRCAPLILKAFKLMYRHLFLTPLIPISMKAYIPSPPQHQAYV